MPMWSTIGHIFLACWPAAIGCALLGYLIGSFNTAIVVSHYMGKGDIRAYGSGNAGATNMLRSLGKRAALLTTLGDLAKSILAVMLGEWLLTAFGAGAADEALLREYGAYLAGGFCILGHLYPLYFGFRGGKGVMATLGMALVLDWKVALLCLGLFIVIVAITRLVSLGSVCAGLALIVLTYVFRAFVYNQAPEEVGFCTLMSAVIVVLLIIKHIPNIRRILSGTESRISFHKKKEASQDKQDT